MLSSALRNLVNLLQQVVDNQTLPEKNYKIQKVWRKVKILKVCISVNCDKISEFQVENKVHFSAGFRKIGDMALRRLCMALKNFQEKIKAAKPSRMALTIGQGSGHKWCYVHERYGDLPPLYVAASLTSSFLQHSTCTSI